MLTGLLAADPHRFVEVAGRRLSHPDLVAAAMAVADDLDELARVAVLATPRLETVVAVTGALLAGVEVVPVPPDSDEAELAHILTDGAPEAWLAQTPDGSAGDEEMPLITVDVSARADIALPEIEDEAIAFVTYTSGVTGLPEGVRHSRRAVTADLDALVDAWEWTASDLLAHGLPLHHVDGLVLGVLGPLRVGGSLVHTGSATPEAYAAAAGVGATVFFGVPTTWSRIADAPEHASALRGARLLVSGGEALTVPVLARLKELTGHEVVQRYGLGE